MKRGAAALVVASLAIGAPSPAWAQEAAEGPQIFQTQPLEKACIALLLIDAIPADVEWSYWLSAGGGTRLGAEGGRVTSLGAGTEATFGLAKLGTERRYGGAFELRGGPWWQVSSDLEGGRAEGGWLFSVGQESHAQWGTYALRLGGGLGDDGLGLTPHVVATLTGGVRYVKGRYSERGACDPKPAPRPSAFASGVRLFATARTAVGEGLPWQLTFGVELDPTFFLPPYSLGKWIGAR